MPFDTRFLNPFQYSNAGELRAVVGNDGLWPATIFDDAIQFSCNP